MDPKLTRSSGLTGRPAPKRRGRIVIRRRPTGSCAERPANSATAVASDLPTIIPVLREEIAILRAYLAREIDAILFDEG